MMATDGACHVVDPHLALVIDDDLTLREFIASTLVLSEQPIHVDNDAQTSRRYHVLRTEAQGRGSRKHIAADDFR